MARQIAYQGRHYDVSDAHPAADALPWHLDKPDFAEMVEDMRAAGFDHNYPVVRHAETRHVISGRRRELAARVAGIAPAYREVRWDNEEVCEFVRRDELIRRNLDASERAAAVVRLADLLPQGGNHLTGASGNIATCARQNELAAEAGVSKRTITDAVKVKKASPELLDAVAEGKLPAHTAAKVADLPPADREEVAKAADPKKVAKKKLDAAPKKPKAKTVPANTAAQLSNRTGDSEANEGQPKTPAPNPDDPFDGPAEESTADDPALDSRFMPNATEAREVATRFRNWKARLESVRAELRKTFPDRTHVLAARIDARGQFEAVLGELIDTLDRNLPEHVCPACCGTGDAGGRCKFCDGYGVIDRGHHAGLVPTWRKTAGRLADLRAAAEGGAA